jgi:betaine-aldehyde dehydrogenase
VRPQDILVGGEWRPGTGQEIVARSPYDGTVAGVVAGASADDVDEAVRRSDDAMRDPAWQEMPAHERAQLLHAVGRAIEADGERLARLQTTDNGKPITETRGLVASAAGTFRYVAAALETLDEEMPVSRGPYISMSVHQPLGVVGAITPWNSPIASDAQKLAPALAAGNAVVLKPAEWTPLVALELGRTIVGAGIPAGLVSVLPGPGRVVGQAIVDHPLVRKVAFTGGTTTGRRIAHTAADKVMPVSLELGGKSPNVVFDDADLDLAVRGALYGIFSSQGQACIAGSRLFVQRSRYDEVLDRLVRGAAALRVGDPHDERTHLGPLVTEQHLASVDAYVRLAEAEGGTVVAGGKRLDGVAYESGTFYPPTIVTGLTNAARVCQEEIFGPVLVVLPFDDEDDLVQQANDSVFGLACGLWTESYRRAWRVARRIEAGTVWINTYKLLSSAAPFGGLKDSGIGREKGRSWIREYAAQKSLYWGTNEGPIQWTDLAG